MKITKLRSELEEEKPLFTHSYAILVHKSEMKKVIGLVKDIEIPKYLKRIKSVNEWAYVLVTSHNHKSLSKYETIKVKIPHKQAYTEEQHEEYKKMWPCNFYKKQVEQVDFDYVSKYINILINHPFLDLCTGCCLIVHNDTLLKSFSDSDNILGHSVFKCVDFVSKSQVGYLCTGFDAFIFNEPCLSCSMVFVHGRIKRVFCLNRRQDGSFSKFRFNFNKEINHRYDVYFVSI